MKCLRCGPLIKAIDAYLAKAENDLYEQLTMEGYLKAKESLNTVDEIEEVVTKLLEDNADDLLKELADAIDLETFFKDNWPKFKNKSKLAQDLFDVFHTQFSTIMPTYVEAYVQKTDAELTVTKLTKRTTDWISSWSSDLADIMKLDTETEIEAVLKKGLNDGKGINDVANLIADSGIRSPGYRARRVALTEVLRAHGYAQLESYIQSPAVEEKMWKHTGLRPSPKQTAPCKSRRRRRARQAFGQNRRSTSEGFPRWWMKAPYFRSASGPTSPTSPDSELTSGTKTTLQTRTKPRR